MPQPQRPKNKQGCTIIAHLRLPKGNNKVYLVEM
jgi:hypothetical protein